MKSERESLGVEGFARVVVSFTLPSNGEKWNWPTEGEDSINALCEILDRANIAWSVRPQQGAFRFGPLHTGGYVDERRSS